MKPLALICVLVLCFSMVACGNTVPAETKPTETVTAKPTTKPTAKPTKPADPNFKTIYVHTSVTTVSDTMDARTEYQYDDDDRLMEVIQYSGTAQTQRYSVVCDENGNFTQWKTTVGTLELAIHYDYNEDGQSLGSSQYHNGELMASTTYVWKDGLHTETVSTMPAQNQTSTIRYTYNSMGVRVREDHWLNDVQQRYGVYTLDDKGRAISISYYLANGTAESTTEITYGALSQTWVVRNSDGAMQQKTVTTYDQHGNLLEKRIYDSENRLQSTQTHTWMAITVPVDSPRASV